MNESNRRKSGAFLRNVPNMITGVRIIASVALIFTDALTLPFFIVYALGGVSDALDGFLARKLNASSAIGSVLDSFADIAFYLIMMVKLMPVFRRLLNSIQWLIVFAAIIIHALAYIVCAVKYKRFSSVHTYANKALGFVVFLLPFAFIGEIALLYNVYVYVGGSLAVISSTETLAIHIFSKEYDEKNKSIFLVKR